MAHAYKRHREWPYSVKERQWRCHVQESTNESEMASVIVIKPLVRRNHHLKRDVSDTEGDATVTVLHSYTCGLHRIHRSWRTRRSEREQKRASVQAESNKRGGRGILLSVLLEQVSAPTPRYIPPPPLPNLESVDADANDNEGSTTHHDREATTGEIHDHSILLRQLTIRERIDYDRLSFLQRLDPRVKIAYAILIAVAPSLIKSSAMTASSLSLIKFSLCFFIGSMSLLWLPVATAAPMIRRTVIIALFAYVGSVLGADSISPPTQTRGLPAEFDSLSSSLPTSNWSYRYTLLSVGPIHITQRGLKLAASSSTLAFCVLQTASLVMSTTTPEQIAAGIGAMIISPAAKLMHLIGVPHAKEKADRLIVMFLLALRFVDIVFQEARNIALGVATRGIQWSKLGAGKSIVYIASLIGRFFRSMFEVSISISEAMVAKGFTGVISSRNASKRDKGEHAFMEQYTLTEMKLKSIDYVMIVILIALIGCACITNFS